MIKGKEKIIEIVNNMPDDVTLEDAMYTLFMHSELEKSREDIQNGRVITLEELEKEMEKMHKR